MGHGPWHNRARPSARLPSSPVSSEINSFPGTSALSVMVDGTKAVGVKRSENKDLEAEQNRRTSYM